MLLPRFLLALGLLSPLAALAQAPAPVPAYYVGAGLYSSAFQNLGYHYGLPTVPVQVLAGYRWHPRWAVQLGATYSGSSTSYASTGQYLNPSTGATTDYADAGHTTNRRLSLTLLARRTLTRQPAHRVQFDALGGFTYEHLNFREQGLYTATPASQVPASSAYDYHNQNNDLLVGLGLGTRVRVAGPVEAAFDYLLATSLTAPGKGSNYSSATSLSVRYSFGPR